MSESTLEPGEVVDSAQSLKPAAGGVPPGVSRSSVVFARLLVGLIILICAEVFSGASIQMGLPSVALQLFTFVFYALAIAGLWLSRRREPLPADAVQVDERELKFVKILFALLLGLALALSPFGGTPALFLPIVLSFVIWTPLGFLLTAAALVKGVRERIAPAPDSCG